MRNTSGTITAMKRIISQVNFLTPLSNAVSTCWPARLLAILPKYVCAPVATMTAVAEPLSTLVPRKQRLVCSMDGDVRARVARVGFFHRQRFAGQRGLDDEQILGGQQPHVAGNHVAGGKFHHVAGHEFLERNFLRLAVAQRPWR